MNKKTKMGCNGLLPAMFILVVIIIVMLILSPIIFAKIYNSSNPIFLDGRFEFWGSVLGGAIGGLTALLAVYFTMNYYKKKDEQTEKNAIYEKQLSKINKVVDIVINRDVINYDFTLAIGFSEDLLQDIINYNSMICRLKGYFTEYGIGVLNRFQEEYNCNLKESRLSSKVLETAKTVEYTIQRKLGIKPLHFVPDNVEDPFENKLSVIEFLNLKPELRQCAERIGHFGLYENASDLIHSDPTLSYILEIEAGGSAGMWASTIHNDAGGFGDNPDGMNTWKEFRKLVKIMLIKLDKYKNDEYNRIVIKGQTSIVPQYYIKSDESFMHEMQTVGKWDLTSSK